MGIAFTVTACLGANGGATEETTWVSGAEAGGSFRGVGSIKFIVGAGVSMGVLRDFNFRLGNSVAPGPDGIAEPGEVSFRIGAGVLIPWATRC